MEQATVKLHSYHLLPYHPDDDLHKWSVARSWGYEVVNSIMDLPLAVMKALGRRVLGHLVIAGHSSGSYQLVGRDRLDETHADAFVEMMGLLRDQGLVADSLTIELEGCWVARHRSLLQSIRARLVDRLDVQVTLVASDHEQDFRKPGWEGSKMVFDAQGSREVWT